MDSMMINKSDTHILPTTFRYHSPSSLEEAIVLLNRLGQNSKVLAGGTDLLIQMKQGLIKPKHLVNIKNIPDLKGIKDEGDGFFIGATTKLRNIERSKIIESKYPILRDTVKAMASIQIRNMATLGGNLCNASPAADTSVTLIALGAKANIARLSEDCSISLNEFFVGPGETVMHKGDLLTGVKIPYPQPDSGTAFVKLGRTNLDIATVNAAVSFRIVDNLIQDVRIVVGAVAPVPIKMNVVEKSLEGKIPGKQIFEDASEYCCDSIKPITDIRASADYRVKVTKALVYDALVKAWSRAKEE
jgi:carbon-monoxide dehydrogenase medium subunit